MKTPAHTQPAVNSEDVIRAVRGEKALLDADVARIYGVPVKRLNEQVKRNSDRFPGGFMFQLTAKSSFRSSRNPLMRQMLMGTGRKLRPVRKNIATRGSRPSPSPSRVPSWPPMFSTARKRCG